jgi:hypothetical protein
MRYQIAAAQMTKPAYRIKNERGFGFGIVIFEFHKPGTASIISDAQLDEVIGSLEERVARLKGKKDFKTPEEN